MSEETLIDQLFERQKLQLRIVNRRLDILKASLDRAEISKRRFVQIAFWMGWAAGSFGTWLVMR